MCPRLWEVVRDRELLQTQETHVALPPCTGLEVVDVVRIVLAPSQQWIEHVGILGIVGTPAVTDVGVERATA